MAITLTKELAYAAGTTAGTCNMQRHGRTSWNEEDAEIACRATNRLLAYLYPRELVEAMCRDGLIDESHPVLNGWREKAA